jgi:hypothetical protein
VDVPEIRYAKNGDVSLAYQVLGDAPLDLLFVPGFISNLELNWELAGSGLVFVDAGEHELKGVPDRWHLYRVVN